jgi:hypothetical protein
MRREHLFRFFLRKKQKTFPFGYNAGSHIERASLVRDDG